MRHDLDKLAGQIHAVNLAAGWWDGWEFKTERHETAMMLVVTELAEAAEGVRKNLMDDHLPSFPMLYVELADAFIRLLDLAGAYELEDLYGEVTRQTHMAVAAFELLPNDLARLNLVVKKMYSPVTKEAQVYAGIHWVWALALYHDLNLLAVVKEKVAYNMQRADHKRENRAKAGGKKW